MISGIYDCFEHWHKQGTVWVYSDPHFGDKELAYRPTAEEQINAINSKCGRGDTLIILGDVGDIECVRKLRARHKILIAGNHDAGLSNYKRVKKELFFRQSVYQRDDAMLEMMKLYPDCYYNISEEYDFEVDEYCWKVEADNKLFDEVYGGPLVIGEKLILSHEPVDVPWALNLHGHVHALSHKNDKHHFNCCAEHLNYIPLNLNQFMRSGPTARIDTIHRETIDKATVRARKRKGGKK